MCGVPSLVIPFDVDQPSNAERVERKHLGHRCNPTDCSSDKVYNFVSNMLEDRELYFRVGEMRSIFWRSELRPTAAAFIARAAKFDG